MANKYLTLLCLSLFAAGCGLETRTYVMTKPRVGLDETGNGGCIVGKCPPQPPPKETTRKVYVLEITKPVPESQVQKIEESAINAITEPSPASTTAATTATAPAGTAPAAAESAPAQPQVPVVGELPGQGPASETGNTAAPPAVNGGNTPATYTVQKDDTLQKISKKVYGTYKRWYRIYKANKDKISNPNFLRPGTVLTIPAS